MIFLSNSIIWKKKLSTKCKVYLCKAKKIINFCPDLMFSFFLNIFVSVESLKSILMFIDFVTVSLGSTTNIDYHIISLVQFSFLASFEIELRIKFERIHFV